MDMGSLARNLASSSAFAKAVQSQDVKVAAEAAVEALLKMLPLSSTCVDLENPPPKKLVRKSSGTQKEGAIIIGSRMLVRSAHKRTPVDLVGAEVIVLAQEPGGWHQCQRCDTDAIVRVNSKCLVAIPDLDAETQEIVHQVRKQMLDLEEFIPWNAVSKAWKSRRPGWRKTVRSTERISELAERLRDLLSTLVWEKSWKAAHGGRAWENEVEMIVKVSSNEGNGDQKKFWSLWETISREVRRWVQERDHAPQPFFVRMPPHKTARIALAALEEAAPHGEEGIEQVPMEAITNFDIEGIHHLKMLLLENKSKLCGMLGQITNPTLDVNEKERLINLSRVHMRTFLERNEDSIDGSWTKDHMPTDVATDCSDMDSP